VKICIVSSCGGHLTEVRALRSAYEAHPYFYVLNDKVLLPDDMKDKTYFIAHSERDWKFFLNLWEAFKILRAEKPQVILSTGAGPVVPFAIIGRLFFGTYVIYIETITKVSAPSMTGKIMKHIAHRCFYQWPSLQAFFPQGVYGGPLL
jgi:UDP-N-acetylglucosamine:LPS N-acetylglucosamine transferase